MQLGPHVFSLETRERRARRVRAEDSEHGGEFVRDGPHGANPRIVSIVSTSGRPQFGECGGELLRCHREALGQQMTERAQNSGACSSQPKLLLGGLPDDVIQEAEQRWG
jgi:hypothetical protein